MNASRSIPPARPRGWRRWLRGLGWMALAFGVVLAVFLINLIWFKPFSFRLFCERTFVRFAVRSPELMTQLGLADAVGIHYFNKRLDDRSEAHARRLLEDARRDLGTLRRYDRGSLTEPERLSAEILEWFMEMAVEAGDRFFYHGYVVNQMEGIQVSLPSFMVNVHPLRTRRDARDYLARLALFGRAFDEAIAFSRAQTERGIVPPRFVIGKVIEQVRAFVATDVKACALYTTLAEKLPAAKGVSEAQRQVLLDRAAHEIGQTVYPAFRRLGAHFEQLEPRATDDAGAWKLPDGAAFYAYCLRQNTTTGLSPAEVHQIGLAEVERITGEIREVLESQGMTGGSVAEHLDRLARDPRFLFSNDDAGRRQAVDHLQRILDEADRQMTNWFGARPRSGMVVQRVEPFREQHAAMGQYQAGSLDGARPGIFYANLRDMTEFPRFAMRTLAYHEGIPGHHFQISLAQELEGVPTFRRVLPFAAYAEGWALYAERLMFEVGFHEDPFDNLGRLQDELFRAARLVVDPGLHFKRWTRQQAIDYLQQTTGMPTTDVANEIDRYIVWPGQACAYKIGMLRLLDLRETIREARGTAFSLRDFHDAVLLDGAMPLGLLERHVTRRLVGPKP